MYLKQKDFFLCSLTMIVLLLVSASCSTIKNYPHNRPFIFETRINLNGNISKDEKKRLKSGLANYWDDSLRVPRLQKFGFFYSIKTPPAFDSLNIIRSIRFMNAYLNSQGYYYADFPLPEPVKYDTVKNQLRTTVTMNIHLGKNITIDSVGYAIVDTNYKPADSSLQRLAVNNSSNSYLKKGKPYTKQVISNELDRLTGLFRDSGYYRISRDDIYAEVDTTDKKLLQLTFDPVQQVKLIAEAAMNRKENPKWDIIIRQKPLTDTNRISKYYINKIYYYPEIKLTDQPDSILQQHGFKEFIYKETILRYKESKFIYKPLREHTYLHHNNAYNETNYYKSINSLNQLGAWQQVDAKIVPVAKDSLDLYFFLTPALKQSFSVDLEGSRNTGDLTTGNLLGIATNFTYRDRNVWKRAIQSVTSLRLGTELNIGQSQNPNITINPLLQTFQVNLNHSYSFPKLILPQIRWKFLNNAENKRTVLSIAGAYTDRRDLYQLRSLTTSWGYEFSKTNIKTKSSTSFSFRPLNIELYKIDTLPGLDTLFANNPFLRNSFRDGNVFGTTFSAIKTFNSQKDPGKSHYIRFGLEESGTLPSLFTKLGNQVFDYIKLETEYRYVKKYRKSELAGRYFIGAAFPKSGQTIPVFKQYFLGGPNSMRAWGLRELGLGSSIQVDTISTTNYKERFGDMAMEANLEYRFPLFDFSSFKISSALFTDIGNIWSVNTDTANQLAEFSLKRLGRDLAIGVGTGLRFDFSFVLLRLDFAYKLKDPARQYNDGWADLSNFRWSEKRAKAVVNNYAIQFGIGLPF